MEAAINRNDLVSGLTEALADEEEDYLDAIGVELGEAREPCFETTTLAEFVMPAVAKKMPATKNHS